MDQEKPAIQQIIVRNRWGMSTDFNNNSVFLSVDLSIQQLSSFSRIYLARENISVVQYDAREDARSVNPLDAILEEQRQKWQRRRDGGNYNFMEFVKKDGIFLIVEARLVNRGHRILTNCRHGGIALAIVFPDLNFRRALNPQMRSQVDKILVSDRIFQLDRRQPQPLFHFNIDENKYAMKIRGDNPAAWNVIVIDTL